MFLVGMLKRLLFFCVDVRIAARLRVFVSSKKASRQSAADTSSSECGGEQWWWLAAEVSSIRQVAVAATSVSQQLKTAAAIAGSHQYHPS